MISSHISTFHFVGYDNGMIPFQKFKFREILLQAVCRFNEYRAQSLDIRLLWPSVGVQSGSLLTPCLFSVRIHFAQTHLESPKSSSVKYLVRCRSYQMDNFNVRFALKFDRRLESNAIDISTKCHDYEISNRNLMASMIHKIYWEYIDSLVQGCRNSSALAMELTQSCTKPPTY